jgi:SAM-dependent methyltransferase
MFPGAESNGVTIAASQLYCLPMPRDEEIINRWTDSAPYWEKHREIIRHMFAPVTEALAEAAQIGARQAVLDIATGPGEPALALAALVGPQGKIVGVDPIPEMVEAARRETERQGLANAQFEVAFADQLPFADDAFDAVVSRFGVMFFRSPIDGIREMLRVLKPGRRLALAVWHSEARNPFHYVVARVVKRYVDTPPVAPDAPDPFRFAAPGKLREILNEAGVTATTERLMQFTIHAPVLVDEFWDLRLEISVKLREKINTLSDEQRAQLKHEALEAMLDYSSSGGIRFPAEVLIVSGVKGRASGSIR